MSPFLATLLTDAVAAAASGLAVAAVVAVVKLVRSTGATAAAVATTADTVTTLAATVRGLADDLADTRERLAQLEGFARWADPYPPTTTPPRWRR